MMPRERFEENLKALHQRRPFQPFVIEFDGGDRFVVGQPEALMYGGGDSAMFFGPGSSINLFHSEAVNRLIELKEAASA